MGHAFCAIFPIFDPKTEWQEVLRESPNRYMYGLHKNAMLNSNLHRWATGADAPTAKQKSFISTLAAEKGAKDIDPSSLNKSEASMKIDELKNTETKNPSATAGEPIQNPNSWTTGDDKATPKQTGYIAAMAREAGEKIQTGGMGKTEASKAIGELKEKTGM